MSFFIKVCRHERNNDEGDEGKSEFMEEKTTPKDTRRTSEGRHHHHERHPHRCYHGSYKKQQHGQRIDYVGEDIEQAQRMTKHLKITYQQILLRQESLSTHQLVSAAIIVPVHCVTDIKYIIYKIRLYNK